VQLREAGAVGLRFQAELSLQGDSSPLAEAESCPRQSWDVRCTVHVGTDLKGKNSGRQCGGLLAPRPELVTPRRLALRKSPSFHVAAPRISQLAERAATQ